MNDILAQLAQLAGPVMQSPQGQAMAQAIMSQLQGGGGQPPMGQAGTPRMATDQDISDMEGANDMIRGDTPRAPMNNMATGEVGPQPDPRQTPMPGGMNPDGPTPEEIELLKSRPTPRNMQNFNKLFGPGAAEQVLQGGNTTYEDDVRGAMDDVKRKGHRSGESTYDDEQGHDD